MNFSRCGLATGLVVALICAVTDRATAAAESGRRIGVATVDITPDYNVRLNGFGNRRSESQGVTHKIYAKSLAIDDGGERGLTLLITVDNLGVPDYMTREVAKRLGEKSKLDQTRLSISSSHTHTAPMLTNCCPTIFGMPITPDEQAHVDRYTRELTNNLEKVALAAIADLKPGRLEWGLGTVDFAKNRRTPGGPVDHDLPLMVARDQGGKLCAIWVSYACHCVTLSNNKISGDWAGFVQELVQNQYPGVVALTSIGCGGDANPSSGVSGDKVELAQQQGAEVAKEVARLLEQPLTPLTAPITTTYQRITLPFDSLPSRAEFEARTSQQNAVGYHARVQLAKLDRGEKLQTELSYPIQTWTFGDQLAMVFLPGEVVVDYSLRLKKDFDRNRLWINAYSNDVPCYIPSERILKEGGYEGEYAMYYYDRPTKLKTGIEKLIVDEVHHQVPRTFEAPRGTEGVAPRSAAASLRAIRARPGLEVELVAAEPLVTSPVAIDWGADGRLWVCEMFDYPTGAAKNWEPGGRVRVLSDTDGDGKFDKAEVFLDKLPFPTGITAWGKGVFICAAPDILYAEDTDGDGKADKVEKRYSGFATDNFQARVNSLSLGLDNWIYGANGLLGGVITGPKGKLDIRGHDFRFRPSDGVMEMVGGNTQQGRVRDDWGRWFGCDNSNALFHYPFEQRYFARNPHAPSPPPVLNPPGDYDLTQLYPVSHMLERFNNPESANHVTAACGVGVYRDTLLGDAYYGNTFTCEPVHNLVHRLILEGDATAMTRHRDAAEHASEFLASIDNWFRPVQARTGPDGALYIVDMYRFMIEHPRWIPAERLAHLDVRAGADMGRIYRVKPAGATMLRPVRDFTKLSAADLAVAMNSPNGTDRDRVHVELLNRNDSAAAPGLEKIASDAQWPAARLQALAALDGIGALKPAHVARAMKDRDEQVRKQAVRLSESHRDGEVETALLALVKDTSPAVRTQLAFSLGEWNDSRAGDALAKLALSDLDDADLRAAVLSSATHYCGAILAAVMAVDEGAAGRDAWIPPLVATAAGSSDDKLVAAAVAALLPNEKTEPGAAHFAALSGLLDALDRRGVALSDDLKPRIERVRTAALRTAGDNDASVEARGEALKLLGRGQTSAQELDVLCRLVADAPQDELRAAALSAVAKQPNPDIATRLLANWQHTSPAARAEIINVLLGREEWTTALLAAVKDKRVAPQEVSLADRQRLATSSNASIKQLAADTFPARSSDSREQVIRQYASVTSLKGEATKGQEVFAKNCSSCHVLNGVGHEVGPDLAVLRDKDPDYFVKNVLDPNAVIEPRFVNYNVILKDRRVLAGIIKSETATSLALSVGAGAIENVARADIKDIRATGTSMMPEGLEAGITPQQMADLIAFIKSGTPRRKQLPENTPALVKQGADGSLMLPATKAEFYGDGPIVLESEFKNVGWWSAANDYVAWTAQLEKAGDYDVYADYACEQSSAGNKFVISFGDATLGGAVTGTGPDWSNYRRSKIGTVRLGAGQQRVKVRPDGALRNSLMDLRALALTPKGVAPKWPTPKPPAMPADLLLRDAPTVARFIMDGSNSDAAREAALNANPQFAADLITEMTRDLAPGATEQERIPWIWRIAIAAGRRNDASAVRRILEVSLPRENEPLRNWQAVVIGGGIINGITQAGAWPAQRVKEIIGDDAALNARWNRALDLASPLANDAKIATGTRYDALRMLGAQPWDARGEQLSRYLAKDADAELQAGAVSAMGDVNDARATQGILAALPNLSDANRKLAVQALLRDEKRIAALRDALTDGKVDSAALDADAMQRLGMKPK